MFTLLFLNIIFSFTLLFANLFEKGQRLRETEEKRDSRIGRQTGRGERGREQREKETKGERKRQRA